MACNIVLNVSDIMALEIMNEHIGGIYPYNIQVASKLLRPLKSFCKKKEALKKP